MRFTSPRLAQRVPTGIEPCISVRSACRIAPNRLTCQATKKKRRSVFITDEGRLGKHPVQLRNALGPWEMHQQAFCRKDRPHY